MTELINELSRTKSGLYNLNHHAGQAACAGREQHHTGQGGGADRGGGPESGWRREVTADIRSEEIEQFQKCDGCESLYWCIENGHCIDCTLGTDSFYHFIPGLYGCPKDGERGLDVETP